MTIRFVVTLNWRVFIPHIALRVQYNNILLFQTLIDLALSLFIRYLISHVFAFWQFALTF